MSRVKLPTTYVLVLYVLRLITRGFGTWVFLYGGAVILSGDERRSLPIFDLFKLLPGAPYSWGVILLLAGVLIVLGSLIRNIKVKNVGLYITMFWFIYFLISAIWGVFFPETSILTDPGEGRGPSLPYSLLMWPLIPIVLAPLLASVDVDVLLKEHRSD